MNVFIANVGNRDIALGVMEDYFPTFSKDQDGREIANDLGCKEGTRHIADHILSSIDCYYDNLRFPILAPALLKAITDGGVCPDKIILFATNQTDPAQMDWDTIGSACLIKKWIQKDSLGKDVQIVEVKDKVSEYVSTYEFIGETLEKKLEPFDISKVYASIKGGIPAMNSALRDYVVQRFGPKAHLVETDEPPRGKRWNGEAGKATISNSWPFRKQNVMRLLRGFLNRHDYSAALQLLEAEAVGAKWVKPYLEHALARTNLDFDGAVECLEEAGRRDKLPNFTNSWKNSVADKYVLQRLDDLAHSAQIALERHDYVGFLYRVTTFSESCLRLLCWIVADIRVTSGRIKPADVKNKDLRERLDDDSDLTRKHWKEDKQAWEVNHDSLSIIIKIAAQCSTKKSVDETLSRLDGFDRLKDLRNDLAHSNKGASLPEIRDRFDIKNQAVKRAIEGIEDGETEFCPSATFGTLTKVRPLTEKIVKEIRYIWIITRYELPQPIIPVYDKINKAVLDLVENWKPNP